MHSHAHTHTHTIHKYILAEVGTSYDSHRFPIFLALYQSMPHQVSWDGKIH